MVRLTGKVLGCLPDNRSHREDLKDIAGKTPIQMRGEIMLLGKYYEGIEIHRNEKVIYVKFLVPHRVISTCRINGGIRDDLDVVFNHQACEPVGHTSESYDLAVRNPQAYFSMICDRHNFTGKCASLGTAANMNCASIVSKKFREIEVVAICTAGVETNAGRAGDPAAVYEKDGRFENLNKKEIKCIHEPFNKPAISRVKAPAHRKHSENSGTINTILCISRELTPGALVRSIVTATEAKTAALWELNVNSRYSDGLATGTGTDQIAVACKKEDAMALSGAGKHTKLGELVGLAVKQAVTEALAFQNRISPQNQRSVVIHIERFGTDSETTKNGVASYLSREKADLFKNNFIGVDRDPVTVAAVAALVQLKDKLAWKILPESCTPEIFASYGAHLAAAVAGKYNRLSYYRKRLSKLEFDTSNGFFLDLIYRAIAMGFEDKWNS